MLTQLTLHNRPWGTSGYHLIWAQFKSRILRCEKSNGRAQRECSYCECMRVCRYLKLAPWQRCFQTRVWEERPMRCWCSQGLSDSVAADMLKRSRSRFRRRLMLRYRSRRGSIAQSTRLQHAASRTSHTQVETRENVWKSELTWVDFWGSGVKRWFPETSCHSELTYPKNVVGKDAAGPAATALTSISARSIFNTLLSNLPEPMCN